MILWAVRIAAIASGCKPDVFGLRGFESLTAHIMKNLKNIKDLRISVKDIKEFLKDYRIDKVEDEFRRRVVTLIIASLGIVTALAWDSTLKEIYIRLFGDLDLLSDKIFYSLAITLLSVIVSVMVGKSFIKKKTKKKSLRDGK